MPHFRRIRLRGIDGPLLVSDPDHIDDMSRWFVQSAQRLGEPINADFNGNTQRGVGFYQLMNRHGKRSSAAYGYIDPQADNKNLNVQLHAEVHRVIIDNGKACGVEYTDETGTTHEVYADGDIVLSAGALITPKLLMLSGIGPADHLREHGITVKADVPGVGQHLIDHPEVPMTELANGPYGYYKQGTDWQILKNAMQFKLFGTGPITSAGVEAGAFVNPSSPDSPPSIQAFCVPIVYLDRDAQDEIEDGYGLTVTTVVIKPKSRGEVRLSSGNHKDMSKVSPNLLKHPDDMQEMIGAQLFLLKALQAVPLSTRLQRIAIPSPDDLSDAALSAHCRRFVKTNYHPSSTARIGADGDPMAVLDASFPATRF